MPVGKLRADGAAPKSPKTCSVRNPAKPTVSILDCGYSTELNYDRAELVGGELVVTLHTGIDSEGDGPIENPPEEKLRIAVRASSLAVAPYEQTFADALRIFCGDVVPHYLVGTQRSVAFTNVVHRLVSNPRALELFRTLAGMAPAHRIKVLRGALAKTAIQHCDVLEGGGVP